MSLLTLIVSICAAIIGVFIVPAESVETTVCSWNHILRSTTMNIDLFIQNSLCDGTIREGNST